MNVEEYAEAVLASVEAFVAKRMAALEQRFIELELKLTEVIKSQGNVEHAAQQAVKVCLFDMRSDLDHIRGVTRAAVEQANEVEPAFIDAVLPKLLERLPPPVPGEPGEPGTPGKDGESVSLSELQLVINKAVADRLAAIELPRGEPGEPGAPGKDAVIDVEQVKEIIKQEVRSAIISLPTPKDGADGKDATITQEWTADVIAQVRAALPSDHELRTFISAEVQREVAGIEVVVPEPIHGKDGESVTIDMLRPVIEGEVAKVLLAMPKPRDGKDVSFEEVRAVVKLAIDEGLASLPAPKDGRDGVSPSDFGVALLEDGRTLRFTLDGIDKEHDIKLPMLVDRGVYKEGHGYERGDLTTWAGSAWIAQRANSDKPGSTDAWRLAVKNTGGPAAPRAPVSAK